MRIVLDTNVLVSGLLSPYGVSAKALSYIITKEIEICFDMRIFGEYKSVLYRDKFKFNKKHINTLLNYIREYGILLPGGYIEQEITFRDKNDLPFWEIAIEAKADYLITGNKKHYPRRKWIVSPDEFLRKLS